MGCWLGCCCRHCRVVVCRCIVSVPVVGLQLRGTCRYWRVRARVRARVRGCAEAGSCFGPGVDAAQTLDYRCRRRYYCGSSGGGGGGGSNEGGSYEGSISSEGNSSEGGGGDRLT